MKNFEKKIRIMLFSKDGEQLSDRLLSQDVELRQGPKDLHEGPLRVEVSLFSQEDVNLFKDYVDKLKGKLPIESQKKRGRKRKNTVTASYRDEVIKQLSGTKDPGEFYKFLEEEGFTFTNYQLLQDLGLPVKLPEEYQDSEIYRIAIRLVRKAKNPLNNKYDPTLLLVIPRKGDPIIRGFNMTEEVLKVELDSLKISKIKIPKTGLTKFPHYMTAEERNKFRVERDKLIKDPESKPSRFYKRWVHPVADQNKGKGLKLPYLDEIERPY